MANLKSGTLGGANLTANNWIKLYTCSAPAVAASFTASFCNKTIDTGAVQLCYTPGADQTAPGTIFWEFNGKVDPEEPLERTGLAVSVGMSVWAMSDRDNIDVAMYGYEKGTVAP